MYKTRLTIRVDHTKGRYCSIKILTALRGKVISKLYIHRLKITEELYMYSFPCEPQIFTSQYSFYTQIFSQGLGLGISFYLGGLHGLNIPPCVSHPLFLSPETFTYAWVKTESSSQGSLSSVLLYWECRLSKSHD